MPQITAGQASQCATCETRCVDVGQPLHSPVTISQVCARGHVAIIQVLMPPACHVAACVMQVRVQHSPYGPCTYVVKGLDNRSAERLSFKLDDGTQTTVAQYFKKTYNVNLLHGSTWPCVMVSKKAAIPLELCT